MIIRFILFLIFFYLAWFLIRNLFVKPFRQGYQSKDSRDGAQRGRDGKITINTNGAGRTHDDKSMGEYIDYEEVEEEEDKS